MGLPKTTKLAPGDCRSELQNADRFGGRIDRIDNSGRSKRQQSVNIATIDKTHACQLRVSLSTWRRRTKIELADFTAVISGIFFQSGSGITLDIERLPELIVALQTAEAEARACGLLPTQGGAAA